MRTIKFISPVIYNYITQIATAGDLRRQRAELINELTRGTLKGAQYITELRLIDYMLQPLT